MSHRRNHCHLRRELVQEALHQGISSAARAFHTSRKTVRKWLPRFQDRGLAGSREESRAPHRIPHKTPPEMEAVVVKLRQSMPAFGPRRLKLTYGLHLSIWAIARILRKHGLKPGEPAVCEAAQNVDRVQTETRLHPGYDPKAEMLVSCRESLRQPVPSTTMRDGHNVQSLLN